MDKRTEQKIKQLEAGVATAERYAREQLNGPAWVGRWNALAFQRRREIAELKALAEKKP